ncbi:MAG: RNA polymerase sporulation sigma factor SigK [Acetobacteraceae bacterium]|nr:RNA polymerase sporulation sigma factor SigK [Acetobacteraceae bacterium]
MALGYLSGGGAFPQPLDERQERELLLRKEGGDPDARNLLVEHNLRLVAHVVKKFDNTGEDTDDLISIGTVGLIKAIQTYDRSKGTRLATYAARCIENEILMYLRSLRKTRGEVSLYEPIGVDKEGNEIALIDILGTDPDAVPDQVGLRLDQSRLRSVLALLRPREREVLELRYGLEGGQGWTQRQVARALGISRSYVSRIEKRGPRSTTAGPRRAGSRGVGRARSAYTLVKRRVGGWLGWPCRGSGSPGFEWSWWGRAMREIASAPCGPGCGCWPPAPSARPPPPSARPPRPGRLRGRALRAKPPLCLR